MMQNSTQNKMTNKMTSEETVALLQRCLFDECGDSRNAELLEKLIAHLLNDYVDCLENIGSSPLNIAKELNELVHNRMT